MQRTAKEATTEPSRAVHVALAPHGGSCAGRTPRKARDDIRKVGTRDDRVGMQRAQSPCHVQERAPLLHVSADPRHRDRRPGNAAIGRDVACTTRAIVECEHRNARSLVAKDLGKVECTSLGSSEDLSRQDEDHARSAQSGHETGSYRPCRTLAL